MGARDAIAKAIAGIKAYHGSPHSFDKFDVSKIGTGEGAQTYGHGLYFAEKEDVARHYRDALKWKGTDWNDPQSVATYWVNHFGGDAAKAQDYLESSLRQNAQFKSSTGNPEIVGALDILKRGDPLTGKPPTPGHMYEVNINADPKAFVDWDKTISQQPRVDDLLALRFGAGRVPEVKANADYMERPMSGFMYDLSHPKVLGSPERVSDAFRDIGVPGVKYLDANSRFAQPAMATTPHGDVIASHYPPQTSNYVVNDPGIIDITRKYGIAAAPAGAALGMGALADQSQYEAPP